MAVWIEVGPGFPGRGTLGALALQLDAAWTVYSDVLLPATGGRKFRLDAVVVGPNGIHALDFWMRPGRLEVGPWEWRLGAGGWVKSPALLLGSKVRALLRSLRMQGQVVGPLELRQTLVLPEQGTEVRNPHAALPRGAVVQGTSGVLARLTEEGGPLADVDRLRRSMERVIAAAGTPSARPDWIGDWRVHGELEVEPRWRTYAAEREGEACARLRVVPVQVLESKTTIGRSREAALWEADLLEDLGRVPGFPAAGRPFEDATQGICQVHDAPGICVATWVSRHTRASEAERMNAAVELARVVVTLHRNDLVHGAIGPWNLRLADRPDAEAAWLDGLDLWRPVPPSCVDPQVWDRLQERFLAPELLLRWSRPTQASDQFGLGVALRHLFERELGGPSSLALSPPRLRKPVAEILRRMTAHRPVDRFRGVEAVVESLEGMGASRSRATRSLEIAPGTRIDSRHEVIRHLHEGRRASVYQLRHLETGSPRVMKLAQRRTSAERALAHEAALLQRLVHPRLPRSHGPGPTIGGRPSWIFDFLPGEPLEELLRRGESLSEGEVRRYCNDLMDGLLYLHREGVTHGDLHPRHLLIGDGHLGIVDFSGQDALPGPGFRDPSRGSPVAARDRYAAALCLFLLMTGRPAFAGGPPRPGLEPELAAEQFDCADGGTLAGMFRRALHPDPTERFSSAREMRAALVAAQRFAQRPWSVDAVDALRGSSAARPSASTECLALSAAVRKTLRRGGIRSVGELADLEPEAVRRLPLAARRIQSIVLSIRDKLQSSGLGLGSAASAPLELPLVPELAALEAPLEVLGYSPGLLERLGEAGLRTVGELALQGRTGLRQLSGIGPAGFGRVMRGLAVLQSTARGELAGPATLEELWTALCGALEVRQREYLEARHGVLGTQPKTPRSLAKRYGVPVETGAEARLLAALVPEVLAELLVAVECRFLAAPGWIALESLAAALEARWPREGTLDARGVARLVCELQGWAVHEHRQLPEAWVSRRGEALEELLAFATAADRLGKLVLGIRPEGARAEIRRSLRALEDLALEPLTDVPSSPALDAALAEPKDEEGTPPEPWEILAGWQRRGDVAQPERGQVAELLYRFGTPGLLLGWVAEGGAPEELLEAGLLLSCGEPRPPSLVPRGLRKITALVDPPLESRELRQLAIELAEATLPLLGAPLRRELQASAARRVAREGLDAGPSAILACGWKARCAEIVKRLAAGLEVTAPMLEGLGTHLCADENAEERDLVLELGRLRRCLASGTPPAGQEPESPVEASLLNRSQETGYGDLAVARVLRAMERSPWHRGLAKLLLEQYSERRMEWDGRCRAAPGGLEPPIPVPEGAAPRRPSWWDAPAGGKTQKSKEGPLAAEPRQATRPTEDSGVPEVDPGRQETGSQLELDLPVSSGGNRIDLPSGLEPADAKALRTVASRNAVTERELAAALDWPMARVVGSMARLQARLHSRGWPILRVDVDASGASLYRFVDGGPATAKAHWPKARQTRVPDPELDWDLDRAAAGAGGWRLASEQGAERLAEVGRNRDFGVSELVCGEMDSIGSMLDVYRTAVSHLRIAGGGVRELMQHWLYEVTEEGQHSDPEAAVQAALAHLGGGPVDLARALSSYWSCIDRGELQQGLQIAAWLAGVEPRSPRGLRRAGLGRPPEAEDAPWLLRLILACSRQLGFSGWIVILHGAERLLEPAGREQVRAIAALARWTEAGRMPGLQLVLLAADSLEASERRRLIVCLEQELAEAPPPVPAVSPRPRQKRGAPVELSLFPEEVP